VVNYIFSNNNDGITFTDETKAWGMDRPSNSNGAAYADLDNDGDLDVVVNNVNQPAFVYQNESDKNPDNHYLQIKLQGDRLNSQGIGAKVAISSDGKKQYLEQMSAQGYLSAVSPLLHFGLGKETQVDSLIVTWLSGKQQVLVNVKANQAIRLSEAEAKTVVQSTNQVVPLFKEIFSPISFKSPAVSVNDFKRQPLLISQPSFSGPCMVKGDVNHDGLEDVYVGGESGQAATLFIQQRGGKFVREVEPAFESDKLFVDASAVFFDANRDGHQDLYVASGGYHNLGQDDALLQDRLYLNNGKGKFTRSINALPSMRGSKGCVVVGDVNKDGNPDLFVGGRIIPGRYPETPSSYLLVNDGKGNFADQTGSIGPELQKVGMVTDAVWTDINQDQKDDLILVGEWMPVSVFVNVNGKLQNQTDNFFAKRYSGWWNKIVIKDFNNDQRPDLLIGNMGTNTQFTASEVEPAEMYFKDFDSNGSVDPFFCFYIQGKSFPYVTRDELLEQIGSMRKRFTSYSSYADITIKDIFKADELSSAGHLQANHMQTTLFVSATSGKFSISPLPVQAQYSPVHTITVLDFDQDGHDDLLLCGNNDHTKIRLGKSDANYGVLLKGNGKGDFEYIDQALSGFAVRGDVRSVIEVNKTLLFGISQHPVVAYRLKK